jgi:hypothetical protein
MGSGIAQLAQWLDYGMKIKELGFDFRQGKNFSLLHSVQTGSGVHKASCSMGTVGSFLWGNRPKREDGHSPPPSADVKNIRNYTSTPPVTVAARSKAWNVFTRLNTGIVSSNPARGMDICKRLCCPV